MSLHTFRVEAGEAGCRLDVYLAHRLRDSVLGDPVSRSAVQRMIAGAEVRVNGCPGRASARLRAHDLVEIDWQPPRSATVEAERLPLNVLYEDEDCIVVNKAPGMVVHPAAGNARGTLVNALLYHCADLRGVGGERRPGIIHRLDKDTSGAMVVAKHAEAFQRLAEQFKNRTVRKEYVALVWGRPPQREGVIQRSIGRHRGDRKKMASKHLRTRAREALTRWELEKCFDTGMENSRYRWVCLLRLRPLTGRTHQIRVHLADENLPIVGDSTYGLKPAALAVLKKAGLEPTFLADFPRQALHAHKLAFQHPRTGAAVEISAPLFDDMEKLLARLRQTRTVLPKTRQGIDKGVSFA